ncbi:MAG: hypothetical protein J6T08_07585, partial [Lentisphaeria bacterium]|nr:hypothetical protein [Lentisphaeria bacterium]
MNEKGLFRVQKKTYSAARSGGTPIPAKTMQAEYVRIYRRTLHATGFCSLILAFSGANLLKRLQIQVFIRLFSVFTSPSLENTGR